MTVPTTTNAETRPVHTFVIKVMVSGGFKEKKQTRMNAYTLWLPKTANKSVLTRTVPSNVNVMLVFKSMAVASVMISTSVPLVALISTSVDKMPHAKTPVDHTHAHAKMVSHSILMVRHAKISMNVLKIPTTATRMQLALTPAAVSHANANLDSLVME